MVGTVGAYGYDADISSGEIGYSIFRSAWCHCENIASSNVLEKSGFSPEGLLKQAIKNADGSLSNQKLYGVIMRNGKHKNPI